MMPPIVTSLLAFIVPGGIIFLAALGFLRPRDLPPWVQGFVHALPFIVLAFGLFFGWFLSSSRLILSLIILVFADCAVILVPPTETDPKSFGQVMFSAAAFLVPLNLLALSLIKVDPPSAWPGALRLALILFQPLLILAIARSDPAGVAHVFQQPLVPIREGAGWTSLSQPALFAFSLALVLISGRYAVDKNPMDGGTVWALLAVFVAFHKHHEGWSAANFFSAAGLILFLTFLQAWHQRSYRDELTGALGKLAYEGAVANLGKKFVLAVVGLDQVKQYGNLHGKSVSDQVLRLVAPRVMAAGGSGKVFRLAGEEFTVLFSQKTAVETLVALEHIRKAVEHMTIYLGRHDRVFERVRSSRPRSGYEELVITASIGFAETGNAGASLDLVTKAAYRALYDVKGAGGNQVKRGSVMLEPRKPSLAETGRIVAYSEFEHS
ncbi:MAG: hypothetical protein A4E19_04070 [Nitrospira sp. SG-bin1]|nr:MAG: hypothetical protein A4E19_04070 [Nitrospira sp. SG-bin1]